MEYTLVLLSGGIGSRMNNATPKQYLTLSGKPMIAHILKTIDAIEPIKKIVIVCAEEYKTFLSQMCIQYGIKKAIEFAPAGTTRQNSVLSGLKKVKTKNVIIHEAARPFVTVEDYYQLIDEPCENAMMGIEIPFTVLKGHDYVEGLLDRSELVNVQLPHKFNTKALFDAHLKAERENRAFTEDSSLLFYYNPELKIKIVKGKDYDIKVTTSIDMIIGEAIYSEVFGKEEG